LVRDRADGVVAPAVLVDLARVSLVALINWTYLSKQVDLGSADDHGKAPALMRRSVDFPT
jgi:hypothetical protein